MSQSFFENQQESKPFIFFDSGANISELATTAMVDADPPLGPLGRLCCNRRARARGEKTSAGFAPSTATPCTEAEPVQSTSDTPDDGSDASKVVLGWGVFVWVFGQFA